MSLRLNRLATATVSKLAYVLSDEQIASPRISLLVLSVMAVSLSLLWVIGAPHMCSRSKGAETAVMEVETVCEHCSIVIRCTLRLFEDQ